MTFSRLLGRLALIGATISLFSAPLAAAPNTGLPLPGPRLGLRTNAPARTLPAQAGRTNNAGLRAGRGGTNAPSAALSSTNATQRLVQQFRQWQASPRFYPALVGVAICLALLFLVRGLKSKSKAATKTETLPVSSKLAKGARAASTGTIHSCNVLEMGPQD